MLYLNYKNGTRVINNSKKKYNQKTNNKFLLKNNNSKLKNEKLFFIFNLLKNTHLKKNKQLTEQNYSSTSKLYFIISTLCYTVFDLCFHFRHVSFSHQNNIFEPSMLPCQPRIFISSTEFTNKKNIFWKSSINE